MSSNEDMFLAVPGDLRVATKQVWVYAEDPNVVPTEPWFAPQGSLITVVCSRRGTGWVLGIACGRCGWFWLPNTRRLTTFVFER